MEPHRILFGLAAATAAAMFAQGQQQVLLGENTTRISSHVWAIMGFPNIGIVVGPNATLVVDTGMGPRNGATVARVATRLSPGPNRKFYLTTTHFHPEHATGEPGFPAGWYLIRNRVQQEDMEQHGQEFIDMFSSRSEQNKALLAGVKLRAPDELFDREKTLYLGGGVTARLLWFGAAHTKGDELVFVEPDRTLISGDVVQNKTVPNIPAGGGTPSSWLAVLDQVAKLNAVHVLPDHSAPGDGSLVAAERAFIADVRKRALALKRQGVTVDAAGKQLTGELKTAYSDWPNTNVAGFVRSIYTEP